MTSHLCWRARALRWKCGRLRFCQRLVSLAGPRGLPSCVESTLLNRDWEHLSPYSFLPPVRGLGVESRLRPSTARRRPSCSSEGNRRADKAIRSSTSETDKRSSTARKHASQVFNTSWALDVKDIKLPLSVAEGPGSMSNVLSSCASNIARRPTALHYHPSLLTCSTTVDTFDLLAFGWEEFG